MITNEPRDYGESGNSLPPRRIKHSKKTRQRILKTPKPQSKDTKSISENTLENGREAERDKSEADQTEAKAKAKKRSPFIMAQFILTVFILLVGSLIVYFSWQWFNG